MMIETIFLLFIGLEIKHFIADYLLQYSWMIRGKLSLGRPGGYVHAAIHVAGTCVILAMAVVSVRIIVVVAIAEFIVHYILDFTKANLGKNVSSTERPHLFWSMNGLDQLLHHLTYVAIIYIVSTQLSG